MTQLLVPRPEMDADAATWWDATRDQTLLVQRCRRCGHHQHYPRMICLACGGTDLSFVAASGRGSVYSFTVVHRAISSAFSPPYVIALVRLDEGPLMLTRIVETDAGDVGCDRPVELRWQPIEDGRHLPVFAVVGTGG